jgi:beta-N-acetylhexosaminidase
MEKRRRFVHRSIRFVLTLLFILSTLSSIRGDALAQTEDPREKAQALLAALTPEEKVGQLFLVTFTGPDAGARTQIYDLITNHHIGGVVLLNKNDNFLAADQTLPIALALTRQLQINEYNASSLQLQDPVSGESFSPAFVPMFIAISQEGDGHPYDQIINGMSPLPSEMAIGATWNPDLAWEVGQVLGKELSYLGINMVFGPSLDVLESPQTETGADLGVRTFGGDPYWVGEMGKAFVAGIHEGAGSEMAVVAKHFPGFGSSDRLPEEEVATVRKSLEQLKLIELAPFFAVTGDAPDSASTVDALLTSHIRYQGFHENIRATTRPISLDSQALNQLMALPQFSKWRSNGGVMVSYDLGGQAIRKFYESTGQTFAGRWVARDAFQAGNDLLYISDFSSTEDPESYNGLIRTLDYFSQKYREDEAFAKRVDESVLRILTLKYRLYGGSFSLTASLGQSDVPNIMGQMLQVSFDTAQQAATLVNPTQLDLDTLVPDPPGREDRIVFVTDIRAARQCSNCPLRNIIEPNTLENVVIRFYSPGAGGEVLPGNLLSYSFQDLQEMLDSGTGIVQIENDLRAADWVVFSMLNLDPAERSSSSLKQFLGQRPDLIQGKKLIVFSFNAPYYLDSTEISKLTAYYSLYSKTPKSIDVAARLLFREIQAVGALPVTVNGAGYDLNDAVLPDPEQVIPVLLDIPPEETPSAEGTPQPQTLPDLKVGNSIPVRTGIIFDANGHQVPDNTVVRFIVTRGEGSAPVTYETTTVDGVARAAIRIEAAGRLDIRAESENAKRSDVLGFEIPPLEGTQAPPTETPVPTATTTLEPTGTPTATPSPTPTPIPVKDHTSLGDWFLALVISAAIGAATYWITSLAGQVRWGVRTALLALLGGMLAYLYLALKLPGTQAIIESGSASGVVAITILGAVAGWGASYGWKNLQKAPKG